MLNKGIYTEIPLNISEIHQDELNIANKFRSNPLRWNGQFSPQLVQTLLREYASPTATLFDPFLGSGTLLLEAGLAGFAASGTEINPAAVNLARTYKFINVPMTRRRVFLRAITKLLQREFPQHLPLFQSVDHNADERNSEEIKATLANLAITTEERLQRQLLETLMVMLDFYKPGLSVKKVFAKWSKLRKIIIELPFSAPPLQVFHADARQTPLADAGVDLVITSPPYINVFNYHQQYRASMEALHWNLLKIAKSEIGANRKHRGNRFLTVIQFCLDIAQTFNELRRVCSPNARVIFVVGRESTVRGTAFLNGAIVAEVAHRALGFDLILRQERVFLNRFGRNIFEDILHFAPPRETSQKAFLDRAREIAQDVLQDACLMASDGAKDDIKTALANIYEVQPSPLLNGTKDSDSAKRSTKC